MLDQFTLSFATATVVVVTGITFIINALLWRDDPAGRVWSFAFNAGIVSVIAEVVSLLGGPAWGSVLSDGAFVLAWWLIWSGLRVYNQKNPAYLVTAIAGLLGILVSYLEAEIGWGTAEIVYLPLLAAASTLTAIETGGKQLRGRLYARPFGWVTSLFALYTATRFISWTVAPADSTLNSSLYFEATMSLVVIAVLIFAALSATMLRAERLASQVLGSTTTESGVRVLEPVSFTTALAAIRATESTVNHVVVALTIDDEDDLREALGREVFDENVVAWRERLTQLAGPTAIATDLAPAQLGLVIPVLNQRDAATRIDQLVRQAGSANGFTPGGWSVTMSVGAAMLDHNTALELALAAATQASSAGGNQVIFAND